MLSEKYFPQICEDLHDYRGYYNDVLECGFSNVNPSLHLGICLLNMGMVESETCTFHIFKDGLTPSGAKLATRLDEERKAVAKTYGYDVHPTEDFLNIENGYDWETFYQSVLESQFFKIEGPNGTNHRFFIDDIPHGLVPWKKLGMLAGIEVPAIDAVIRIFSIIYDRDWLREGTGTADMGIDNMPSEKIKHYLMHGKW